MVRVYTGATGRCLFRTTPEVDADEQARISKFVRQKILLWVDPSQQFVAGVITVRRQTQEPFVFVVETDFTRPIRTFYETVEETCRNESTWELSLQRGDIAFIESQTDSSDSKKDNTTEGLTDSLLQTKTTISHYEESQQAVRSLVAALEDIQQTKLAPGPVIVSQYSPEQLDVEPNHVLIFGGKEDIKDKISNEQSIMMKVLNYFRGLYH